MITGPAVRGYTIDPRKPISPIGSLSRDATIYFIELIDFSALVAKKSPFGHDHHAKDKRLTPLYCPASF
jgi:hypothetical protein